MKWCFWVVSGSCSCDYGVDVCEDVAKSNEKLVYDVRYRCVLRIESTVTFEQRRSEDLKYRWGGLHRRERYFFRVYHAAGQKSVSVVCMHPNGEQPDEAERLPIGLYVRQWFLYYHHI